MRPAARPVAFDSAARTCASPAAAARHEQGHGVAGADVGLADGITAAARGADRRPELDQGLVDVAEVAQHDPRGLVRRSGDGRRGPGGDQRTGPLQGLVRA